MATKCSRCYREGEFAFEEEYLCLDHYELAVKQEAINQGINERDAELEDRRLFKK